jgi:hypothetical protein
VGEAIGDVLPLGAGVALSPVPIIAVVLMLVGRRARVNGTTFVLGWLVGLAIVELVVLRIAGPSDASDGGDPATWVGVLKLVLGALLLLVAARQLKARPGDGDKTEMPKWMGAGEDLERRALPGLDDAHHLLQVLLRVVEAVPLDGHRGDAGEPLDPDAADRVVPEHRFGTAGRVQGRLRMLRGGGRSSRPRGAGRGPGRRRPTRGPLRRAASVRRARGGR